MTKYRKKPIEVEAIQYDGYNKEEIEKFTKQKLTEYREFRSIGYKSYDDASNSYLVIKTLEGDMIAQTGDYIIKGVKVEFYLCKPDIFEATYEKI